MTFIYTAVSLVLAGVDLQPNPVSVSGSLKNKPGGKIWSFATGGEVACTTLSSDGKVVYVGSDNNNLYAVNTSTGRKIWSVATSDKMWGSPVLSSDGEVLYLGYSNLHAVNALTGSKIWSFPSGFAGGSSAVLSSDGKVLYFASDDGHLYAVNTDGRGRPPGAKIWSFLADTYLETPTLSSDGKVVYVGSGRGNLYAVNALTGSKIWSFATGGGASKRGFYGPPVLSSDGKVVYVGSSVPAGAGLHAINALTGSKIWSSADDCGRAGFGAVGPLLSSVDDVPSACACLQLCSNDLACLTWQWISKSGADNYRTCYLKDIGDLQPNPVSVSGSLANAQGVTSPVLSSDDKIVYVGGIGKNAYAVNASTGSTIWTFATYDGVDSSPFLSIDGKVLYFWTSPDAVQYPATVFAANAVTGSMLWSFETGQLGLGGPVEAPPTLSSDGKVMYVGSDNNNLYAVNTSTGRQIWSFATGGYVDSSPVVSSDNKVVYFGSEDYNLYAFYA